MSLGVKDFGAFHAAVHGKPPFAWQQRLLERVDVARAWPRVLDLPTGSGKTTCVDIALFALALDAGRPPAERWCARRIAMVVDRRVVVDQAAERGRAILRKLMETNDDVVGAVAAALRGLVGDEEEPLAVYTLRGGIAMDDGWARTPHQPLIIASTVDQLGSRLLIQGYGVSRSMRPVHAGLLANDTLVLLDEVHLSQPFAQTLERLARLRSGPRPRGVRPLQYALLSATPGEVGPDVFRLGPDERDPASALGQRLHARKPARLAEVPARRDLPDACSREVDDLLERHAVVAVVVNRVLSARDVATAMRVRLSDRADVVLLTGRMRPLDRDDVLAALRDRIATGRDRAAAVRKLVVVGTQCIEAGADFDFDALVTESASLDALKQRFGRLDRLGEYGRSEGVVLHVKEGDKEDFVYGTSLRETWTWLREQRTKKEKIVDFGIEALPLPEAGLALQAPKKNAPSLLPAYLDLWAQTSPEPAIVPDVSLFLHGPDSGPPDVQVIWRADLLDEHLAEDSGTATAIVEAVRPSTLEAVSVPCAAVRHWLAADGQRADFADAEHSQEAAHSSLSSSKRALRWRGERSEVIDASALRPGDTIVVPAVRGGLRDGTFEPMATEPVADLAERAALLARGRAVLRLHPAVLRGLSLGSSEDIDAVDALAEAVAGDDGPPWKRAWLGALTGRLRRTVIEVDNTSLDVVRWTVVEGARLTPRELRAALHGSEASLEPGADTSTDEETSIHAGRPGITLARHSADVERFVREYGTRLSLPKELASDLALAGWLHDIGKADRRFQLLLRGGDEIELLADETLWAKSKMATGAKQAHELARERSRYPRGARHEVQSVAMIEAVRDSVAAKAHDLELVLHLVGSHHGYCRPFAPPVTDDAPEPVNLAGHASAVFGVLSFEGVTSQNKLHRLDSPLADRFWSLVRRYGWLELCWLEAILRLADHRASEEEERGGGA